MKVTAGLPFSIFFRESFNADSLVVVSASVIYQQDIVCFQSLLALFLFHILEVPVGIEPTTDRFRVDRSTSELWDRLIVMDLCAL